MEPAKLKQKHISRTKSTDTKSSDSVQIIACSQHFSPDKSQLQREFSEEDRKFTKQEKRSLAKLHWIWDDVIETSSSKEEVEFFGLTKEDDVNQQNVAHDDTSNNDDVNEISNTRRSNNEHDDDVTCTADSLESLYPKAKIPRVTVCSKNRILHM